MASNRSNQRRTIVLDRHRWAKWIQARGWTLALPLMMVALAGCGGAKAADASTPTPSVATSSAPAESLVQQAFRSCHLDNSIFADYAILGDGGYTITMKGEPTNQSISDYGKVIGLTYTEIMCELKAVEVPDSVVSQMNATRALDGMQRASWNKMSASWTYHPDHGLQVILTESK
ncbi:MULTISPECIES: hypothetical protein [Arthrobacter]|uniref:Uncharacterized protein n=1 Tax=Arthrobacter terricola TaxID=2547396 RepID=A0A4R5KE95_9MICC|nr:MULTISPECIES: hypothetical protein [Arthrobacter]MBT8162552.1 hypothetical protein [Arthrobacter sp. GN70]TDF92888.1 hypothetical protein E1809_17170 [Arthrobacter terricola]